MATNFANEAMAFVSRDSGGFKGDWNKINGLMNVVIFLSLVYLSMRCCGFCKGVSHRQMGAGKGIWTREVPGQTFVPMPQNCCNTI